METNTTFCPDCKAYISLPLRRPRAAFETHVRKLHPESWKRMEATRAELLGGESVMEIIAPTSRTAHERAEARAKLERIDAELATATGVRKAQLANQRKSVVRILS